MGTSSLPGQMRKGVLDLVVLAIVKQCDEAYPSDILARLQESELIVVEGTLYPLLSRLTRADHLVYRWAESSSGPPRKYYKLTASGDAFLVESIRAWKQLEQSVNQIIANLESL